MRLVWFLIGAVSGEIKKHPPVGADGVRGSVVPRVTQESVFLLLSTIRRILW